MRKLTTRVERRRDDGNRGGGVREGLVDWYCIYLLYMVYIYGIYCRYERFYDSSSSSSSSSVCVYVCFCRRVVGDLEDRVDALCVDRLSEVVVLCMGVYVCNVLRVT